MPPDAFPTEESPAGETTSTSRGAATTRRSANASMSLLVDLVTNSLEPEYLQVSAFRGDRREAAGLTIRRRVGAVGALLAVGVLLGVGAWRARAAAPVANRAHTKLVDQVQALSATVDRLASTAVSLRAASDELRAQALSPAGPGALARLHDAERASASLPVTGPGLHLVIDDAPATPGQNPDPASRVTDRDLQRVVNGLWASGAEAISIGGVRLTARSSIRNAGQAVLVDFRPVSLPYSIDAIGEPAALQKAFAASGAAVDMRGLASAFGIRFSVSRAATLMLPAGADLELRLADPLPSAGVGSTDVTPSEGPVP